MKDCFNLISLDSMSNMRVRERYLKALRPKESRCRVAPALFLYISPPGMLAAAS